MASEVSYIPREVLLSAEIRAIEDVDLKAANICYQREDLVLARVVRELGANYHRAWTRLKALEDRNGWTPRGRPPLISWQHRDEIHHNIARSYQELKAMQMRQLQKTAEQIYTREYSKLTPKQQEKARDNLPNGYCYSLAKRFDLTRVKPTVVGKERSEGATTQTIIDFFNITFTEQIAQDVPEDLIFNADETHAEVGTPEKVLVPDGIKAATCSNNFEKNQHVTAMVTINAAGDLFQPYLLLPLAYLPRNIAPFCHKRTNDCGWYF